MTSSGIAPEAVVTHRHAGGHRLDQRDRHAFLVAFLGGNARKHDRVPAASLEPLEELRVRDRAEEGDREASGTVLELGPQRALAGNVEGDPLQPGEGLEEVSVAL